MANDYDASNPDHVGNKRQRDKARQTRIDTAMAALMADAGGRALVWSLLGQCGVFRSSFTPCPGQTAFNEGQRAIGLSVLAHIHRVSPEHYVVMSQEGSRDA